MGNGTNAFALGFDSPPEAAPTLSTFGSESPGSRACMSCVVYECSFFGSYGDALGMDNEVSLLYTSCGHHDVWLCGDD
eukprot:25159-Eustigmatos_ZCMA.PRE.1